MKKLFAIIAMFGVFAFGATQAMMAQTDEPAAAESETVTTEDSASVDSAAVDTAAVEATDATEETVAPVEEESFHKALKTKFIEGDASFMSLVAVALVFGLAFCIERIIYLSLAEIDSKKLMAQIEERLNAGDVEGAKTICRDTRGPIASICYQGLMRINDGVEDVERSITAYGAVQAAYLEKGCSWITLFIAIAPSLGFLGTVIGMVMAFDQIQQAGDISPTVVAGGMKVALITTIFGIIVALVLQVFYNYILSKIEEITSNMEEATISLLDMCMKYNLKK